MAVAVVHGGKTVYAKGFGVKDVTQRRRKRVDPDTVFQLASLSKPLSATVVAHQVGAERDRLGHPDRVQAAVVRAVRSGGHADGHRRRHVLAPLRAARPRRRPCSRTSATTGATCSSELRQLPLDPFRISYAYTNFGLTAGAEAVAVERGQAVGGPRRRGAVRAARHGVDELPVRRLRGPARPRRRPHPRRRTLRAALRPRRATPKRPPAGPVRRSTT